MQGPRVTVVGAGVAGVAAARALAAAGTAVTVLERARTPGGRAASRTLHGRPVDLGASYFTARDERFTAVVDDWVARGLAHRWTDRFVVAGSAGWTTKVGPQRYGTPGGMRTLVEDLAAGLDVRTGVDVQRVGAGPVVDGEPADAVVLAMPDPQAARLLDPALAAERAAVVSRAWEPVLALAAGWPDRTWDLDGCFVDPGAPGGDVLSFLADDGGRRGDGAAVLVAHSTPAFAGRHLASPQQAAPQLVESLTRLLDLPPPTWTSLQRWTFARPAAARDASFLLGLGDAWTGIGLCGDAWGAPRFETAWLSGTLLGEFVARRLRG